MDLACLLPALAASISFDTFSLDEAPHVSDRTLHFSFRSSLLNIASIVSSDNVEQGLEARTPSKGAPQLHKLSHSSHTLFHLFQLICE